MAASAPYFMFYPADYLADTAHLTRGQHASYLLLLMNYWQTSKALNNASDRLAIVAKASSEEWEIDKQVLAEFFDVEGDSWTHGRMEHDLNLVREKSIQASYAGRLGGLAGKKKPEADAKRTLSERQAMNECMNEEINEEIKETKNPKPSDSPNPQFEQFWKIFPRHEGSKVKAKIEYEKALKKVSHDTLIEAVSRLVASKSDPKFIKHAERWLRDERWNDEIVIAKPQQSPYLVTEPTPTPRAFNPDEYAPRGGTMPENLKGLLIGKAV